MEPTKYVDSCVEVSRARSHFLRASDSSWKPPLTIRSIASASVMDPAWMPTSSMALMTARR